jgi:hypothetical protein
MTEVEEATPEGCSRYFHRKAAQWIKSDGSVEAHIEKVGKKGLADEFRADSEFTAVCELIREIGDLQLRSTIATSLEGLVGDQFGSVFTGELNTVIEAVGTACGILTTGKKLVIGGVAAAAAAGIIGAILASRMKKETMKEPEPMSAR